MTKEKNIQNPFAVIVYRGGSHWDQRSFPKKAIALKQYSEMIMSYFKTRIAEKKYQYRIVLTHVKVNKQNQIVRKLLLQTSQP